MKAPGFALLLVALSAPTVANAQSLETRRSWQYYTAHGALTLAGFSYSLAIPKLVGDVEPGWDLKPFFPDDLVRLNFSQSAASLSDTLITLAVTAPVLGSMSNGLDTSFANAGLIYAQAHAANQVLTTATKFLVRRPRPYTHAVDSRIREFADGSGSDAYLSFFSGHASTAHTAATAGSILYSARTSDLRARHVFWGLEFGLAGMVAQLRVRAGRHYRTDVAVGSLIGIGIGTALPALHGVDLSTIRWSEIVVGASALAVTYTALEIIDLCALLGRCSADRDVELPVQPSSDWETDLWNFTVLPAIFEQGAGLQLLGEF